MHVVRQFDPAIGGLESYVKSMALRQGTRGHDVHVLTLNRVFHGDGQTLQPQEQVEGITVKRVPFIGFRRYFIPLVSPAYFTRFDAVHVHNTDVFFDYIALALGFGRTPIFATTHGGFFHTKNFSAIKKLYFSLITRNACRAYDALFAISQNDFDTFKGTNDNLILQPNAIEPMGMEISNGNGFLYLGRLAKHKHVERVIDAYAALKKIRPDAGDLHIVGPDWDVYTKDLKDRAQALGIAGSAHCHGALPREEMRKVALQCGYFLSASTYEGFGMSMLEAMTLGLLPFVHPNESFSELVGQAGVGACVDFADAQKAAAVIGAGMAEATMHKREAAQAFAARFSWDTLVDATEKVYVAQQGKR